MRHTILVHKVHPLVSILVLMTVLGSSIVAQELPTKVLDLTKPAPREQQETGLPGSSVGGIEGQPLPRGYGLPLKIEFVSIDPRPAKLGDKFTVEVRLRNLSDALFFLPASQNSADVLQHEGKRRRWFAFNLIFEDPKNGRRISFVAAVVAGSDTVDGSLLRIEPGREVRVRFMGDLRPIAAWFGQNVGKVQIRAGAAETLFEDHRYFVKSESEEIVSRNSQTIDLAQP